MPTLGIIGTGGDKFRGGLEVPPVLACATLWFLGDALEGGNIIAPPLLTLLPALAGPRRVGDTTRCELTTTALPAVLVATPALRWGDKFRSGLKVLPRGAICVRQIPSAQAPTLVGAALEDILLPRELLVLVGPTGLEGGRSKEPLFELIKRNGAS